MKKTIRLTESELKNIIRKVINESKYPSMEDWEAQQFKKSERERVNKERCDIEDYEDERNKAIDLINQYENGDFSFNEYFEADEIAAKLEDSSYKKDKELVAKLGNILDKLDNDKKFQADLAFNDFNDEEDGEIALNFMQGGNVDVPNNKIYEAVTRAIRKYLK